VIYFIAVEDFLGLYLVLFHVEEFGGCNIDGRGGV
jgi:hypothetical protein